MQEKENLQVAWAAGLFDGEGCISIQSSGKLIALKLAMVDRPTVEHFAAIMGVTATIYTERLSQENAKWRDCYIWHVTATSRVRYCLLRLRPFLRLKGPKADAALEAMGDRKGYSVSL